MKPDRIQDRLVEKPAWRVMPATVTRHFLCKGFLEATQLARLIHQTLIDSPVDKEVITCREGVVVSLVLEGPETAEALFEARDQLDAAVDAAGFL